MASFGPFQALRPGTALRQEMMGCRLSHRRAHLAESYSLARAIFCHLNVFLSIQICSTPLSHRRTPTSGLSLPIVWGISIRSGFPPGLRPLRSLLNQFREKKQVFANGIQIFAVIMMNKCHRIAERTAFRNGVKHPPTGNARYNLAQNGTSRAGSNRTYVSQACATELKKTRGSSGH